MKGSGGEYLREVSTSVLKAVVVLGMAVESRRLDDFPHAIGHAGLLKPGHGWTMATKEKGDFTGGCAPPAKYGTDTDRHAEHT